MATAKVKKATVVKINYSMTLEVSSKYADAVREAVETDMNGLTERFAGIKVMCKEQKAKGGKVTKQEGKK